MKQITKALNITAAAMALILGACSLLTGPAETAQTAQAGNAVVRIAGRETARTIMPTAIAELAEFSKYVITLTKGQGTVSYTADDADKKTELSGGGHAFDLADGDWTVQVDGYRMIGETEYKAASGSDTLTVTANGTNTVSVTLDPIPIAEWAGLSGVFTWNITLPGDVSLTTLNLGENHLAENGPPYTAEVEAGVYDLFIILTNGAGLTAGVYETVYIYPGLETPAVFDFTNDSYALTFTATVPVMGTVTVTNAGDEGAEPEDFVVKAYIVDSPSADPIAETGPLSGWNYQLGIPVAYLGEEVAICLESDNWTFSTPGTADIASLSGPGYPGKDLAATIGGWTVTFDSNGGSAVANQTVAEGGKATAPTPPTRGVGDAFFEGASPSAPGFGGWYTDAACTAPWDFGTDTVTENTTLYAKWEGGGFINLAGQSGTLIDRAVSWLTANAAADTTYTLVLATNIPAQTGKTINDDVLPVDGVTLVITTPSATEVTVTLSGNGSLFNLFDGNAKTLALEGAVKLVGMAGNNGPLVTVIGAGSTVKLNGNAKITGNTNRGSYCGGVYVSGGAFIMNGGEVSGNSAHDTDASGHGGGVYVGGNGTFTMNGGVIYGNNASGEFGGYGGGVYVYSGTFTMNGGTVQGSTASDAYAANTAPDGAALYKVSGTAKWGSSVSVHTIGGLPSGEAGGDIGSPINGTIIAESPPGF